MFLTSVNKTSPELLCNHVFNVVEHSWYECNYTGDYAKIVHSNVETERNGVGNTNVLITVGDFIYLYTILHLCVYMYV